MRTPIAAAAAGLLAGAASADVLDLESGIPLTVEDAYATPFLNREIQLAFRYERTEDGKDDIVVEPRLEFGVWYNTELTIGMPMDYTESDDPDGIREVNFELLHNFNQETRLLPAVSGAVSLRAPVAEEEDGVDPGVHLLFSKTIPGTTQLHRVHLNIGYTFNTEEKPEERDGWYEVALGYQIRATNDLVLVADLVRSQEPMEHEEINLVEFGARYRVTPFVVGAAGVGFGIGDESPDVRLTLGFQWEF